MAERKIIGSDGSIGVKDDSGAYVLLPPKPPQATTEAPAASIDDLLRAGLQNIQGAMRAVTSDIGTGLPSRETIMNLRDLMTLLQDLKKREQDFLDNLTDEQLEEKLRK